MAKTLKKILELYKPKAGDEQKFVAKHVVVKHDDANSNKDDVFQATNVKTVEREKNKHGYTPGNDEKVYEEIEQVDELKKSTLLRYATKANKSSIEHGVKASRARDEDNMEKWAKHRNKADMRDKGIMRAHSKLREEAEQIDELSYDTLNSYMRKKRKVIGKVGDMERYRGTPKGKKMEKDVENYRKAWQKRDMKEEVQEESIKLLELYANLSDENRAHMLEMFDTDKDRLFSFLNGEVGSEVE